MKYQVQASQGPLAVDGIAVENPLVYVYEVGSDGSPKYTDDFSASSLNFFQEDSLINLPGAIVNNSTIVVPEYQLVQPLDQWSDMMDGIRFKFDNALPLSPSAPPFIFPSKYLLYNADGSEFDSLQFVQWEFVDGIYAEAGVDEFIISSSFGQEQNETIESMHRVSEEIIPYFKNSKSQVA